MTTPLQVRILGPAQIQPTLWQDQNATRLKLYGVSVSTGSYKLFNTYGEASPYLSRNDDMKFIAVATVGGIRSGRFPGNLGHATESFQLSLIFDWEVSCPDTAIDGLIRLIAKYGEEGKWSLDTCLLRAIHEPYKSYLLAKKQNGLEVFDEFYNLVPEVCRYVQTTLNQEFELNVQLQIKVKGEDLVGTIKLGPLAVALDQSNIDRPIHAHFKADLSIRPGGKARAIAFDERAIALRDQAQEKIIAYLERCKDQLLGSDKAITHVKNGLEQHLTAYLHPLGRELTNIDLTLPQGLSGAQPSFSFSETYEVTFAGQQSGEVQVMFKATLEDIGKYTQHLADDPKAWMDEKTRSVLQHYCSRISWEHIVAQPDELESNVYGKITLLGNEIGYQVAGIRVTLKGDFPRKGMRVWVRWSDQYIVSNLKEKVQFDVLFEGKLNDLTPWKGFLAPGMDTNGQLESRLRLFLEQFARNTSVRLTATDSQWTSEVESELGKQMEQEAEKYGIISEKVDVRVAAHPVYQKLKSLWGKDDLDVIIQPSDGEEEMVFDLIYLIRGVTDTGLDHFEKIAADDPLQVRIGVRSYLKNHLRLWLGKLPKSDFKTDNREIFRDFVATHIKPVMEDASVAYGVGLEVISFLPGISKADKREHERREQRKALAEELHKDHLKSLKKSFKMLIQRREELTHNLLEEQPEVLNAIEKKLESLRTLIADVQAELPRQEEILPSNSPKE